MSRLFFFILLVFSLQAKASSIVTKPTDTIPAHSKAEYLKIGKRQSTTGIIMVSAGGAAFLVGIGYIASEFAAEALVSTVGIKASEPIPAGYYVLAVGGAVLALCSIPFFKAARDNRRLAKAATVRLNIEKLSSIPTASIGKSYYPAIQLKLRF